MDRTPKRRGPPPKSETRQLTDQFTDRRDVGVHTVRAALDDAIAAIQAIHAKPTWLGPQPGEDDAGWASGDVPDTADGA